MAAAEPSDSPAPPLRRHARRLVFDRRYGWIFDEWTDPADQALSGGRGMFCVVPMAQSLVNAAASSISYFACSATGPLGWPKNVSLPAYISSLALHKKQKTWFHDLEHSGVVADLKLIHNHTPDGLESSLTAVLNLDGGAIAQTMVPKYSM